MGAANGGVQNSTFAREIVSPSTNGHASARGLAKIAAAMAAKGSFGGVRLMSAATYDNAHAEVVQKYDDILLEDSRFAQVSSTYFWRPPVFAQLLLLRTQSPHHNLYLQGRRLRETVGGASYQGGFAGKYTSNPHLNTLHKESLSRIACVQSSGSTSVTGLPQKVGGLSSVAVIPKDWVGPFTAGVEPVDLRSSGARSMKSGFHTP